MATMVAVGGGHSRHIVSLLCHVATLCGIALCRDALWHCVVASCCMEGMRNNEIFLSYDIVQLKRFLMFFFPDTSQLPKNLVLFLHTTIVLEPTGEKMAPKPDTDVTGQSSVLLVTDVVHCTPANIVTSFYY